MKTFILTLVIVLNLESATFKFKDGTVVNGNIFERPHSLGNASPKGILLIVNNKIYIHNYPLKTREKIIDHGNGTYTITEETVPTPAPPKGGLNPYELPACVPARINFIHFAPETLNNIYKYYAHKTKYHKSVIDRYPSAAVHRVAFEDNKAIALGVYKAAYAKHYEINSSELSFNWKSKVTKEYGKKPSWITWLGN
jgi:hypothetical protein